MIKTRNFSFFSAPLLAILLASSEVFAKAQTQTNRGSEKAAKYNQKANDKKAQDNNDGFFNPIKGENFTLDIFKASLDAKMNHAEAQQKRLGKFGEWMSNMFKLSWSINHELRGLNTTSKAPFTSQPNSEPSYSASFEITLDPGKHILGLPSYFMSLGQIECEELIKQNDLYHDILYALCEYFVNKEKLKIHKQALVQFREHYEGAQARFKNGVINQIGLRQAEQNYAGMQAKYAQSLAQVQSSKENLYKYSTKLDLNKIEKTNISFENTNLDEYLSGIGEPLLIREAKAKLRYTRSQSLVTAVSCVTPTIKIRGENLFLQPGTRKEFQPLAQDLPAPFAGLNQYAGEWKDVPTDGGKIVVSLTFDLSPTSVIEFIRSVDANKLSSLNLVKVARETDIAIKNMKIELELQKETVKMYRNSADLKKTIAELVRKKDIRDAEKHYNELLKADSEVAKAYEETQSQIFTLMKIALKLIKTAGGLVPSDLGKITSLINNNSDMKDINQEANRILNGADKKNPTDQKDSKVMKPRAQQKSDQENKENVNSNNKQNNNNQSNQRVRTLSKIKP